MPVQVLGKTSARRAAEVQSDVHALRVEGVLAQVHGQLHQLPEVRAIRWGVGVDSGLRFAKRHQQMAVGVRVPIEEHHAAGITVDDLLFSIAVGVSPVVRQEVWAPRRRRCLGGVDLRFKGADVGHSPRCPKGRVHDRSVGTEIFETMTFVMIQCGSLCTRGQHGLVKPGSCDGTVEKFQELFLVPLEALANSWPAVTKPSYVAVHTVPEPREQRH